MTDRTFSHADRSASSPKEGEYNGVATIAVIAMIALVALFAWLGARSYTLNIQRGGSLIAALNDHYHPTTAAKAKVVYLKSVAIAERCGIPVYERPLGKRSSMRLANYDIARRMANSTDWTMVSAPVFAGDVFKVGAFGRITCTAGPGTKPFADR